MRFFVVLLVFCFLSGCSICHQQDQICDVKEIVAFAVGDGGYGLRLKYIVFKEDGSWGVGVTKDEKRR